jgi:hypothetical protein
MTADFKVLTAHNEDLHHPFIANAQTGSLLFTALLQQGHDVALRNRRPEKDLV